MTLREEAIELIYDALSNSSSGDDHYGIATSVLEKLETKIPAYQMEDAEPPAIGYPTPPVIEDLDDLLYHIEGTVCALENADFASFNPLAFLKSLSNVESPATELRWLADLIDQNYEKFEDEIAARQLDQEEAA